MSTKKNSDFGCFKILVYLALIMAIAKIFKVLFILLLR